MTWVRSLKEKVIHYTHQIHNQICGLLDRGLVATDLIRPALVWVCFTSLFLLYCSCLQGIQVKSHSD